MNILCATCRQPFDAQRRSARFCSARCRVRHHRDPATYRRKVLRQAPLSVTGGLRVVPLTLREANALVEQLHRHHRPVTGYRFAIGVMLGDELHGAAIVGRPVSRSYDWHTTAEVSRLTTDGTPNAASMLYGACARACSAMGFKFVQTYICEHEPGTSLKAAGWSFADHVDPADINWGRRSKRGSGNVEVTARQRWVKRLRQ